MAYLAILRVFVIDEVIKGYNLRRFRNFILIGINLGEKLGKL